MSELYIDFIITYKNGKKEIEVVNGPGVNCSDIPTDKIARKLMGENVEITDSAHTDQYFDEKAHPPTVQEETSEPFIQRRELDESEPQQQIDL